MKSEILSKEEEAQIAREKRQKMDAVKKKYSGRKLSRSNSRGVRGDGTSSVTGITESS